MNIPRNKRHLIIVLLITILLISVYFITRHPHAEVSDYDKALALMESGDFMAAIPLLTPGCEADIPRARDCYALAVSYIRTTPPDLSRALAYKDKASRLGYIIPEWFDNYYSMLKRKGSN